MIVNKVKGAGNFARTFYFLNMDHAHFRESADFASEPSVHRPIALNFLKRSLTNCSPVLVFNSFTFDRSVRFRVSAIFSNGELAIASSSAFIAH